MINSLVPWTGHPFENVRGLVESSMAQAFCGVTMKENPKELSISVRLPDFKKQEIELDVSESGLSIRAKSRRASYYRAMSLPYPVKAPEVKASFDDGVLRIRLPKVHETRMSRVRID